MQVNHYESIDALPETVKNALAYANGQPFFKSIEWFDCLSRHGFESALTPQIYVASNTTGVQCALFCAAADSSRQLLSLTNYYSMEYGPSMVGDLAAVGLAAIVAFIAAQRPRWHRVDLRCLRDGDPQRTQLDNLLEHHGFGVHRYFQHDNWYLDVDNRSFADYYDGLSSRLRNTIKRKGRKAAREHELQLNIYPVDHDALDEAIKHYDAIYNQSWKQPEPYPAFMPALFRTCDSLGIVRAGLASVDGEPAAAQIWINDHDRTVIYKLAYDERYAPLSIGSILSRRLFEHAIDNDGVREIDYGVGSDAYKRDWMSAKRTLGGLLGCNRRTLSGRLTDWRERIAAKVRHLRTSARTPA